MWMIIRYGVKCVIGKMIIPSKSILKWTWHKYTTSQMLVDSFNSKLDFQSSLLLWIENWVSRLKIGFLFIVLLVTSSKTRFQDFWRNYLGNNLFFWEFAFVIVWGNMTTHSEIIWSWDLAVFIENNGRNFETKFLKNV